MKPIFWQIKSKENGSWGPPFNSKKLLEFFIKNEYEWRALGVISNEQR